jgi:hypothetical protein
MRRGGQPGNQNAVKHGRYREFARAERRAAMMARAEKQRIHDQVWAAQMPVTDYDVICEEIRRRSACQSS